MADVPSSQGVSTPSSGPRGRIAVVAIGGVGFAAGALVGAYLHDGPGYTGESVNFAGTLEWTCGP